MSSPSTTAEARVPDRRRRLETLLRQKVERWLRGPDGRQAGARGFRVTSRGGALEIEIARPPHP